MKKFKITSVAISLMLVFGNTGTALADVLSEGGVTVYKNHESPFSRGDVLFSQTGLSSEKAKIIKGYGKNIPFTITLDIVIPKHWDVSFNEGADKLLVNWQTGEEGLAWPYVLEDLSKKNDISVAIDWERKSVNLFAHKVGDVRFNEMANRDESFIVDQQGEKITLEQIIKDQEEYARTNELLRQQVEEKRRALMDNEERIAKLQEEMERVKTENDLNENYGSGLYNNVLIDGDTAIIVSSEDELKGLDISLDDLREEYDARYVLPINPSFDFYKAGGWKQEVDFYTPATFLAKRGNTLKNILESWAGEIGWELNYNTNVHYSISYDMQFQGLAREAYVDLLSLYKSSKRPLDVKFYTKQKLIVVEDLQFKRSSF